MTQEITDFNQEVSKIFREVNTLPQFGYTNEKIAELWGKSPSQVSRFINGKTNTYTGDFFKLISLMPPDFKLEYWQRLLTKLGLKIDLNKDWAKLIENASQKDLSEIFFALGSRCDSDGLDSKQGTSLKAS